jgi:hypothetical protein
MTRHQISMLIAAVACILALGIWVGEIDIDLDQGLDSPAAAPVPHKTIKAPLK